MKSPRKRVSPAELDYVRERIGKIAESLAGALDRGTQAAADDKVEPGYVAAYLRGWLGSECSQACLSVCHPRRT